MNTYTFYWLDGTREVLQGRDRQQALFYGGYGAGALKALDFIKNGNDNSYEWINGKWIKKNNS